MYHAWSRHRTIFAVALAALTLGAMASAQAASAAPYVRYAHFTNASPTFYAGFGNIIDVSVGNSPSATAVCVSSVCRQFSGGEIHVAGSYFGQYWAHGQSRQVKVFACNATCMPAVWIQQLRVP
jgi:hypothetical protein